MLQPVADRAAEGADPRGEAGLALAALSRLVSWPFARSRLLILTFHRVLAARDPLRPDEPDAQGFSWQLRALTRCFEVLPLEDGLAALRGAGLERPSLCITFDDGYLDNHAIALPILAELGLRATFFVASGYLSGGNMWNDQVIEAIRAAADGQYAFPAPGAERLVLRDDASRLAACRTLLAAFKYRAPEERAKAVEDLRERLGVANAAPLMMSAAHLADLVRRGMEVGGHTVNHPILSALTAGDARVEIERDKTALEAIIGRRLRFFAYPNGRPVRDYTHAHAEMVREAGYAAAVTTAWGSVRQDTDPWQLPRITTRGRDPYGLVLRVAKAYSALAATA